ncbi:MAG: hypothetical protein JSW71_05380 [Gemmatimonadota bacterium]|nr:MAG: hypothetical protein JSW71_05380 [Gemmatimonadota bacterium]
MRTVISLTAGLLLVPVGDLSGQQAQTIEPGSRVRVTAPDLGIQRLAGTCLSLSQGAMAFEPEGLSPLAIATVSITRLEISRGRKRKTVTGALVGIPAGLALALGVATIAGEEWQEEVNAGVWLAPAGALVGLVVGGTVGYTVKVDRWEEVPLDRLRVAVAQQRDGRFALGLQVKF